MKNKVFIGALISTLLAFWLYTTNINRIENAQLKVITPKTSRVNKKKTKEPKIKHLKEPKVNSIEYSNHVKTEKGSNQALAKKIKKVMGIDNNYQVTVQDLNNSNRYAVVANTQRTHSAGKVMRLYLLIGLYEQEQKGKLNARTSIKIKKSDKAKGDKMFQTNMAYGIKYLREAMLTGNTTAANALLRKVGVSQINSVAKRLGATQTRIATNFKAPTDGYTTAKDLVKAMSGLYQGRVLNRQNATKVLGALASSKNRPSLVKNLNGGVYSIGDSNFATAIVQDKGHSYCLAAWSTQTKNFNKLGTTIDAWFNKRH